MYAADDKQLYMSMSPQDPCPLHSLSQGDHIINEAMGWYLTQVNIDETNTKVFGPKNGKVEIRI